MAFKPNQVRNVWIEVAGLHDYVLGLAKEKNGRGPKYSHGSIARKAAKKFGIEITRRALSKHLVKSGIQRSMAISDLLQPSAGFARDARKPSERKHPEGWEPHVETKGDTAVAVSKPTEDGTPDEKKLIEGWLLDPKEWMIQGPLNCRRWQTNVPIEENSTDCRCSVKQPGHHYEERWLFYYKANLVRRTTLDVVDIAELSSVILKHKPAATKPLAGDVAFAVFFADSQLGKPDQGGVQATTNRILDDIGRVQDRVRDLRKLDVPVGPLYLMGMGDIVESCDGHYPSQTFGVELNMRDQIKLARRLLAQTLRTWAPDFDQVIVAAVGGNHGERRKDGKAFTGTADNIDVELFEQLEDIFSMNQDAFGHVSFVLPNEKLDLTLDIKGTITTIAHSHQMERGASPAQKAENWWKGQAFGMEPAGDSTLLVTAHNHHFLATQTGIRTHFQCPALECGSDWWTTKTGQRSAPGMLTMTIGKEHMREGFSVGWDNVAVIG